MKNFSTQTYRLGLIRSQNARLNRGLQPRQLSLLQATGSGGEAHQRHSSDTETTSSSGREEISMVPLEPPSVSGRLASDDGTNQNNKRDPRPQPKRSLLQRIAVSLKAFLAAIIPERLQTLLPRLMGNRLGRIFLGSFLGMMLLSFSHMTTRHRGAARASGPQEVVYSDFLRLVDTGNVRAVRFEDGTGRLLFDITPHSATPPPAATAKGAKSKTATESQTTSSSDAATSETAAFVGMRGRSRAPRQFYTRHLPDPQLISRLLAAGVEFGTVRASMSAALVRVFATALALWIPLIPMFIIMRRFLDGRAGGGQRKRTKGDQGADVPRITFADVAGIGAAKAELQEVVACLKDPRSFSRLGAKLPSGVLLCGPPGTGKTLLAKAVAGEAGVPFIAVSASEFVEMFVGRGAARVRELFAEARKRSPCVIFIDELDAVGGRRGAGLNEERDQTLNQLLTELDGFEGRPGIVLLAATNRPDVLDQALMRPGRLSRRVTVPLPDESGRAAILGVHLRAVRLQGGEEALPPTAGFLARLTAGFSGAELANVCNEAAFLALRRGAEEVAVEDLVESVNRQRFGVSGGKGGGAGGLVSLAQRVQGWLVDQASSGNDARSSPMGS